MRVKSIRFVLPLLLALCFVLSAAPARAAERVIARIPVTATGADCTAGLWDKDGNLIDTLALSAGTTGYFEVLCEGMISHTFTVQLTDADTSRTTYDKQIYNVHIELYYIGDTLSYVISADEIGTIGEAGKPAALTFDNQTYSDPPVPPTPNREITVVKIWAGEGPHPASVTVELSSGGTVVATAVLSNSNGWRHTFPNLERGREYSVRELDPPEGYNVRIEWGGDICIVTNTKSGTPIVSCWDDPGFVKIVSGRPSKKSEFVFQMIARDPSYPMPEGSEYGVKEMTISGQGSGEFGIMQFTRPGVYEYSIIEKNTGAAGYTYDRSVYTLRFEITESEGKLIKKRILIKDDVEVDYAAARFINIYKSPDTPHTGDETRLGMWTAASLGSLGAMILSGAVWFALSRRKKKAE